MAKLHGIMTRIGGDLGEEAAHRGFVTFECLREPVVIDQQRAGDAALAVPGPGNTQDAAKLRLETSGRNPAVTAVDEPENRHRHERFVKSGGGLRMSHGTSPD